MYFYYYRRLLQAAIILSLFNFNVFQVMLTLLLNLFFVSQVLALRPYEDRVEQRLEIQNELVLLLTIYFMLLFLPDFIDGKQQEGAGVTIIVVTCINFAINLIPMIKAIKESIWSLVIYCKKRKF